MNPRQHAPRGNIEAAETSQLAPAPPRSLFRPFQSWRERQRRRIALEEARKALIEAELTELHNRIWSQWPKIVEDIHDHQRKEGC